MARAFSLDLRERVVAAVSRGLSCRAVAVRFDVSVASVVKWAQRARATGSPAARPMGGKRPPITLSIEAKLRRAKPKRSTSDDSTTASRDPAAVRARI
jgi:transposase